MTDDPAGRAEAAFAAGEFETSRALALEALAARPDDGRLLDLAGRASLELDADDAATFLRRAVERDPERDTSWRSLGLALLNDGDLEGAVAAFARAVALRPEQADALSDLGHTQFALGQRREATETLERAASLDATAVGTLRSLLEMYLQTGDLDAALATAIRIQERQPDDPLALTDIADLHLALGQLDEAAAAYARLRTVDAEPGHEIYAYHGLIETEIRRERWRRALDLAVDATRVDRDDLTTQILAFVVARVFGPGERAAPSRGEVETALGQERQEHRRAHVEALVSG
jgi:tetratricopeptide (TPR) repeat protein